MQHQRCLSLLHTYRRSTLRPAPEYLLGHHSCSARPPSSREASKSALWDRNAYPAIQLSSEPMRLCANEREPVFCAGNLTDYQRISFVLKMGRPCCQGGPIAISRAAFVESVCRHRGHPVLASVSAADIQRLHSHRARSAGSRSFRRAFKSCIVCRNLYIWDVDERRKPIAGDWARFLAWCRQQGRPSLPASSETLAAYLIDVAPGLSRGTLGRRRSAICTMHRQAGQPTPVLDPATHKALRTAAKPTSARTASPPTPAVLVRMASKCPRDLPGLRDRALLLLAAATLRPRRRCGHAEDPGRPRRRCERATALTCNCASAPTRRCQAGPSR